MLVELVDLESKVKKGINKLGYDGEDAEAIFQTLLYAERRGNNQGIVKIATGGVPNAHETVALKIEKKNKCGVLLSGGHSMVTTKKAAEIAIELAEVHGVGIACSNHTFTSSGSIGYFSKIIAQAGFIGIVCVGNGAFCYVAPTGSPEARFGTNPLSYAFPFDCGEVVFDNATSAMAFFGLMEAQLNGNDVPDGTGYDKYGKPTNDPAEILEGSLATFAGHKGYGLSLMVQMLGGPFCRAATPGVNESDGAGIFVMAIDPDLLGNRGEFIERASKLINNVKSATPLTGMSVFLPGERGDLRSEHVEKTGKIEIATPVWNELCKFTDT